LLPDDGRDDERRTDCGVSGSDGVRGTRHPCVALDNGAWTPSKPVASDNWNITGCPVNGPKLSARGRNVVLTWFTGAGNQPRALAAFSRDAGRTFTAPIRIDDAGTLGRVDAELLADGSAIVSWIERANQTTEFRFRRITADGTRSAAITVAAVSTERTSGFPQIAVQGQELVLAWSRSSRVRIAPLHPRGSERP
jgi:hypothetical protein